MSQYLIGSLNVTNASPNVIGVSTAFLANVAVGDILTVAGSAIWYDIAAVTDDTHLSLTSNYAGATALSQAYAITRDFTPALGLPYPVTGDIETSAILKRALLMLDVASNPSLTQVLTRDPLGNIPVGKVFSLRKADGSVIYFSIDESTGRVIAIDLAGMASAIADPLVLIPFHRVNDEVRLTGVQTHTRTTVSRHIDILDGLLKTAAIDVPVFDRGASGGISCRLEGSGLNSISTVSFRLAAQWLTGAGTTTVSNSGNGIDGSVNGACLITDTSATVSSSRHVPGVSVVANNNATHMISVYIAANQAAIPLIRAYLFGGTTVVAAEARLDTATGLLSMDSSAGTTVVRQGAFWRISIPITNNTTGNNTLQLIVFPSVRATLNGADDVTLVGTCTVDWPQVELIQNFTSSPMLGGALRGSDLVMLSAPGNRLSASEDQTIMMNFDHLDNASGTIRTLLNYGVGENSIAIRTNAAASAEVQWGVNRTVTMPAIAVGVSHRLAVRAQAGQFSVWLDGVNVATAATAATMGLPTNIEFGPNFFGHVSNVRFYGCALSDSALRA